MAVEITALVLLAISFARVGRARAALKFTTARPAVGWLMLAMSTAIYALFIDLTGAPAKLVSASQYLAAVLMLTPAICILGARRPGSDAWPWFVVLPLVLVLQWPTATQLPSIPEEAPVVIPTPTVIGYVFVLIMGAGNYFGTRNTSSMLLGSCGILLMLAQVSEFKQDSIGWLFSGGSCLVAASLLLIRSVSPARSIEAGNETPGTTQLVNELWQSFQEIYGIVWAKRVMDRINLFAAREKWDVELTLDGFRPKSTDGRTRVSTPQDLSARTMHIFFWLMKRFLNREFLLQYLPDEHIPAASDAEI